MHTQDKMKLPTVDYEKYPLAAFETWNVLPDHTLRKGITMELKDTVKLMESTDYKERFKAEYEQLRIRFEKLNAMLGKWDAGTLEFTPTCPRSTYNIQIRAMADYLAALEARAIMEGVSLSEA